jgi:hypothetical protein
MVFISHNHALCIYYQLKFNQENVAKALEKFQPLSDEHEVYYLNDPTIPVLVSKVQISNRLDSLHTYNSCENIFSNIHRDISSILTQGA